MRKFIPIVALLVLSIPVLAQTFQGTIKPGNQINSFICAIKPSANYTAKPTNIQFTLAVPTSVGTRPTMSIVNNFYNNFFAAAGVTIIQTATYSGNYIYLINFSLSTLQDKTYTANTADNVVELKFEGNTNTTNNLQLVQLPDGLATAGAGGENGQYNFYVEFNLPPGDVTNQAAMFYTTTGGAVTNNAAGYTAFSAVSLGANIALPQTILNFSASKLTNATAQINWQVGAANNIAHFEIEAGEATTRLNKIATVNAINSTTKYQYIDNLLGQYTGTNVYYRIKEIRTDGSFSYSNIANIKLKGKEAGFNIINNPVVGNQLTYTTQVQENTKGFMQIMNSEGKLLLQQTINITSGFSTNQQDISQFINGMYLVYVTINGERFTSKFIK